jgi:hypothetical protein
VVVHRRMGLVEEQLDELMHKDPVNRKESYYGSYNLSVINFIGFI